MTTESMCGLGKGLHLSLLDRLIDGFLLELCGGLGGDLSSSPYVTRAHCNLQHNATEEISVCKSRLALLPAVLWRNRATGHVKQRERGGLSQVD